MKLTDILNEMSAMGQMFSAPQPDLDGHDKIAPTTDYEQPKPDKKDYDPTGLGEGDDPCWDGYEMAGWKEKDGKKVPNCIPIEEAEDVDSFCPACLAKEIIRTHMNETLEEAEYQGRKVKLNKPMRGDVKKFKVYVKDPNTGNVKKVNFGDPNMKIKKNNPKRRKSFRARHNCSDKKDKTTAGYWSCKKW